MLGLKRGRLDVARLREKFGVDPLEEWAEEWRGLVESGDVERLLPEPVLTRQGLLRVDELLPRFFDR